jgi:4-hydroxybenzoate polyprenyltransferase
MTSPKASIVDLVGIFRAGHVALRLGRVSNLPTVWTNAAAGVVLASGEAEPLRLILIMVALSLFYIAGMYLNDAFDRNIDARQRPERPIPSGQVGATTVFAAGFAMLALGEGLLALVSYGISGGQGWPPVIAGLALAATIVYYDFRHKTNPLSPVVMGVCRVLVYLTAALAVGPGLSSPILWGALTLLTYLIGLTYAAKQERLARINNIWPLGFLAVPFAYGVLLVLESPITIVIYLGFLGWVGYALSHLLRRGRTNIPLAISSLIAGICFLDALLISGQGEQVMAALAVAGVGLTRLFQRFVPGT